MKARLIRHTHITNEQWKIVSEHVPLGTEYRVLNGPLPFTIREVDLGFGPEKVDCLLVTRPGDVKPGWLPVMCLQLEVN